MLRIVFMGTPLFAVPTLSAVIGAGHDVICAYTQPPRPAGRGMEARKSPLHTYAESSGIPVQSSPRTLRDLAEQNRFRDLHADVAVVVAYGLILPKAVLEAPLHGCLNLHGSALPRWRGAAPIQRAIIAGDPTTAAIVMRMDEGLDTGAICLGEQLEIAPDTTAGELHDRMAELGADLMVRALAALARGNLTCRPQSAAGVIYAAKITKGEGRIDFRRPAGEVHNLVRGLSPAPGAWFEVGNTARPERVRVLRSKMVDASGEPGVVLGADLTIACGHGAVRLIQVQRAGRRTMSGEDFLRGFALPPGTRVSSTTSPD